ncbi:hypothetical protein [Methylobacterium sp. P5_C11]
MQTVRHILAACGADRAFALTIVALGAWSALSLGLLALNTFEPTLVP